MFSESFQEDLETIFNALPQKRQNLLFSATITPDVRESKILPLNKEVSTMYLLCYSTMRLITIKHCILKIVSENPKKLGSKNILCTKFQTSITSLRLYMCCSTTSIFKKLRNTLLFTCRLRKFQYIYCSLRTSQQYIFCIPYF